MLKIITIDFETEPILPRPDYPPKPVGVAIKWPGKKAAYWSWGHPTKNNCTHAEAMHQLKKCIASKCDLLFHNSKFDVDVLETFFDLEVDWSRIHDTLWLLFLMYPRAASYGLKPSAEKILGWDSEEQDAVVQWLIKNQPIEGLRLTKAKKGKSSAHPWICKAPGDLVGEYAIGDVDRTEALFKKLYPQIDKAKMLDPYRREQQLAPMLLEMERQGVPVDLPRLQRDVKKYTKQVSQVEAWLRKKLKVKTLNFDASRELVAALLKSKLADKSKLGITVKSGEVQTNKAALDRGVTCPVTLAMLRYRSQVVTALRVFMQPWLTTAEKTNGLIYTEWHSTRHDRSTGGQVGARTGRLSSTPNFQNLSNEYKDVFKGVEKPIKVIRPPIVRSYIVPGDGCVLVGRDFSQQEYRGLAHFEDSALLKGYQDDPWMDAHDFVGQMIYQKTGVQYDRKKVKTINFGILYGMGLGKLAESLGITYEEASTLKKAYLSAFPNIAELYRDMRGRAARKEPIRTWGGRVYYCEPDKIINGKMRSFDYKLVNVLIQGTGGDVLKEAACRLHPRLKKSWCVLLLVHDEIVMSVPKSDLDDAQAVLRECMESVEFDCAMLTEGEYSEKNWARMKVYDKKGRRK